MTPIELILTALSLSLDAVAVSIAAAALNHLNLRQSLKIALFFGGFQLGMPLLGWMLGYNFSKYLSTYGNVFGFLVLLVLGCKMLYESIKKPGEEEIKNERHITETKTLTLLAISTSIDALVIGVTFNFIRVNLGLAVVLIGIVTFLLCLFGMLVGKTSRKLVGNKIEIFGAAILIFIAFKLLLF